MKKRRVLIIGAGEAGKEARRLIQEGDLPVTFVGYVDDYRKEYDVIGKISALPILIDQHAISELIVAIPSASGNAIRRIIEKCANRPIPIRVIPRLSEVVLGHVKASLLRPIAPEDLLGRPVVKSNLERIKPSFVKRRILITGAAGSIGSQIVRELVAFEPELIVAYDISENGLFYLIQKIELLRGTVQFIPIVGDISDEKLLNATLFEYKIQDVIHAAAYKHVPLMEEAPRAAVLNNIVGTSKVIVAAKKNNIERFIFISTDKAINPTSIMGATKLVAEKVTFAAATLHFRTATVRFGNVLGSEGSVVPVFERQIAYGGPVTVTDPEMVRYMMTAKEAAFLTLTSISIMQGGERFMLEMGEPIRIEELAKLMIRAQGYLPGEGIEIIYTGRRPGEKLFEELRSEGEGYEKTEHEGVWRINEVGMEKEKLEKLLENLEAAVRESPKKIKEILQEALPAYQPTASSI